MQVLYYLLATVMISEVLHHLCSKNLWHGRMLKISQGSILVERLFILLLDKTFYIIHGNCDFSIALPA